MKFQDLRIGYVPYTPQLTEPGDRRRFCFYAKKRELKFELAVPEREYDLVIVTARGDLSLWSRFPRGRTKIVFDTVDSYLAEPRRGLRPLLRGAAKFVTRQSRFLQLSYWEAIRAMCRRADAVICTTEEQKQDILPYCQNVHIILDIQSDDVRAVKTNYSRGEVFNLVWEGLPGILGTFREIRPALENLSRKHSIALHVVTRLECAQYLGKYGKLQTLDLARKVLPESLNYYLYQWNEQMLSTLITACDLALIPLPMGSPLYAGKCENKLLLFWRAGVPTVVSATRAYERAMNRCGLQMSCRTLEEWEHTIEKYMASEELRREAGQRGKACADTYYGEEALLAAWDAVLDSLFSVKDNAAKCAE